MNYNLFADWFLNQLKNDWEYFKKESTYSFCFTYSIDIFDRNLIEYLRPKYPWNLELVSKIVKEINEETKYLEIIDKQNKEISKLKKIIYNLKKK